MGRSGLVDWRGGQPRPDSCQGSGGGGDLRGKGRSRPPGGLSANLTLPTSFSRAHLDAQPSLERINLTLTICQRPSKKS